MGRTQKKRRAEADDRAGSVEDDGKRAHVVTPVSKNPDDQKAVPVSDAFYDAMAQRFPVPVRDNWKALVKECVGYLQIHAQAQMDCWSKESALRAIPPLLTFGKLRADFEETLKNSSSFTTLGDMNMDVLDMQLATLRRLWSYDELVDRALGCRGWYTADGGKSFFGKGVWQTMQP